MWGDILNLDKSMLMISGHHLTMVSGLLSIIISTIHILSISGYRQLGFFLFLVFLSPTSTTSSVPLFLWLLAPTPLDHNTGPSTSMQISGTSAADSDWPNSNQSFM